MDESELFQSSTAPPQEAAAYKKIRVLGEGAMGKAYLVQSNTDGQLYVMKRINIGHLTPQQQQNAMRQAQVHSLVQHPNIIAFKEIYHTTMDKLCIIMQYAENGDLDQLIQQNNGKPMPEETVMGYFGQICMGLREIHSKKIIHRDIKGANIFIAKNNSLKIGDFGISKAIDQTVQASKSFVGTPYYLAPEMVEGKPYSTKADIWALGVLLYNMCAQRLPFEAQSLPLLALKILRGSFPPLNGPYSRELKNLVLSMLQVDAKKRPTITEIMLKPIVAKHIPKEQLDKIAVLKEKAKAIKTVQSPVTSGLAVVGGTAVTNKASVQKKKPTQEEKKAKEKQYRQLKKKKRQEEIREMRDDIRKKRLEIHKDKVQTNDKIEPIETKKSVQHPKTMQKQPASTSKEAESKNAAKIEKPWKNFKNKCGSKKDIEIEILVPEIRPKQAKKQVEPVPQTNFNIQIRQFGKRAPLIQNKEYKEQQQQNDDNDASETEYSEQDQSLEQQQMEVDKNFAEMMSELNSAQQAVRGLRIKTDRQIQLYQQSQIFGDDEPSGPASSSFPRKMNQMNTIEKESWQLINNAENLQEGRQLVEEGLGEERFKRAYIILNEHLQQSESKKMMGEELDNYTFNRQVLRKKLEFLTDKEFDDYIVLMYTLVIIEIEEMKKNLYN